MSSSQENLALFAGSANMEQDREELVARLEVCRDSILIH